MRATSKIVPRPGAVSIGAVGGGVAAFPKLVEFRSRDWLRIIHEIDCVNCGHGPVQAAHSNHYVHGKGRGMKASDAACAALCEPCHVGYDQQGMIKKAARLEWFCTMLCFTYKRLMTGQFIAGATFPELAPEALAAHLIGQLERGEIRVVG